MAGQTIQVSVLADTRQFSQGMRRLGDSAAPGLGRLTGLARTAAGTLSGLWAAAAGGAVIAGIGSAVRAASELEQSVGGLEAVFGANAGAMHDWAREAATSVGLSRDAYNGLATIIGTTLKASGVPMDELGGKTNDLLARSADLAATFGGTVTQSAEAMASALRGEYEPLRAYGISLSAAAIQARALADTGKTSAAALTEQEKALATQALIFDRSTDAAGRFGAEAGTLAGQSERLKAQLENVKAEAGTALLPVLTRLVGLVSTNLGPAVEAMRPALEGFATGLEELGPKAQAFADTVERWRVPILAVAGLITAVFLPHLIALGVTSTVTAAKTAAAWAVTQAGAIGAAAAHSLTVVKMVAGWALMAAQSLLHAARMAAAWLIALGPVGWIIAAVVALAALIIANWDTISAATRRIWSAVTGWLAAQWQTISNTASAVWDAIVNFFRAVPSRLMAIFLNFTLPGLLIKHWAAIRSGAEAAWNGLVSWVTGIPGRLLAAIGNLGALLSGAGRRLIDGLLEGITGGFQRVRDTLGRLTALLPDWKGPAARDRSLLAGPGRLVVDGFVRALRSRFPSVRHALAELTGLVAGTAMPGLGGTLELGHGTPDVEAAARAGAPRVYRVNVNALAPSPEIGRAVVTAIREFERVNGPGR